MKPIASAKHEAQESTATERSEHCTGKERSEKPYRKPGLRAPRAVMGKR